MEYEKNQQKYFFRSRETDLSGFTLYITEIFFIACEPFVLPKKFSNFVSKSGF